MTQVSSKQEPAPSSPYFCCNGIQQRADTGRLFLLVVRLHHHFQSRLLDAGPLQMCSRPPAMLLLLMALL